MENHFEEVARLRAKLAATGFRPVAVITNDKRPFGNAWPDRARQDPPADSVAPLHDQALNTGLLCDGLRVVDIDIDDPELVRAVREHAERLLGHTLVRSRSNSARVAMLYRAADGSPPKRAVTSGMGKVEILGYGQQVVAFGIHNSGAALEWSPSAPGDIALDDLPAATEQQVDDFLNAVALIIGSPLPASSANGNSQPPVSSPTPDKVRNMNFFKIHLLADASDVAAALAVIPNDGPPDWERWNQIGMASWAATSGSADGLAAWLAWSSLHPSYDERHARERWNNYTKSPPSKIGAGTIFHLAQQAVPGWTKPSSEFSSTSNDAVATPVTGPDMSVLRLGRRAPPAFPIDVFGQIWAQWIADAAQAAAAPVDYVAVPLLASASVVIGNARWAQAGPGWREPPHLWVGMVGDSGSSKSPGADCLLRDVLPELEQRMAEGFDAKLAQWKVDADIHKSADEQWQNDAKEAARLGNPYPDRPDNDLPPKPERPRLFLSDVTMERVAAILASAAPRGLLMVRDELAGWLKGMTSYNEAGRAFWIEAYGGRPYRVERQKLEEPIIIPRLAVGVLGTTQPDKVAQMFKEADDGLLARLTWAWPDATPFHIGRKAPNADFAIRALDRLRQLEMLGDEDLGEEPEPICMLLSPTSLNVMEDFGRHMQSRQEQSGGLLRSAYGKARGLALRISLVITLLRWCAEPGDDDPPEEISDEAFLAACDLVDDYFMQMAERVFGDAAATPAERNAATLARWIIRNQAKEVHIRHLQRNVRLPGLNTADLLHAAANVLVEAGWLFAAEETKGTGRPRAVYQVNPAVHGAQQ